MRREEEWGGGVGFCGGREGAKEGGRGRGSGRKKEVGRESVSEREKLSESGSAGAREGMREQRRERESFGHLAARKDARDAATTVLPHPGVLTATGRGRR